MKIRLILIVFLFQCSFFESISQIPERKVKDINLRGVLVDFYNEFYFFPVIDTGFDSISLSNTVGIKLENVKYADIFRNIENKKRISVYIRDGSNVIDTVESLAGSFLVNVVLKKANTKLHTDTSAFSFVYGIDEFVFRYMLRFDISVKSIRPLLKRDIKSFRRRLRQL